MGFIDTIGRVSYEHLTLSWSIEFGDLKDPTVFINPADMKTFSYQENGEEITLQWKGCELAGNDFTVNATWKKYDCGWQGNLRYEGNASKLFIEAVHFPVVDMPYPKPIAHLLVGNEQGWIYEKDDTSPDGVLIRNHYNGMQMTNAMADDGTCVYIDHRDPRHYLKEYLWEKNGDRLIYHGVQSMPCNPKTRRKGELPFLSSVVTYKGTWFQGTQYYREWAVNQPAFKNHIKHNKMRDIAVWLWNRGTIDTVIPPAEKLQKEAGVPVALDWYWWHGNPYDTNYPHYWPPREGVPAFKKAIARLNKQHLYTQVYVNGVSWDIESPSFKDEGGPESAIINRDGTPRAVEYNPFTKRKLTANCGEGVAFQKKIREMVKKLTACGLPGVYLDQIALSLGHNCYSKDHHHSPCGGNYHLRGYRKYVKQIRKENPGIILSSESTNETYMDLFDSFIILCTSMERCGNQSWIQCVPAFSAVFHGTCALFGNFALPDGIPCWDPLWPPQQKWTNEQDWNEVCPYQFYAELARTVCWGMQPTVCNFQLKHTEGKFTPIYDYIKRIAQFYYANRDFLYDGRMLDPKTLDCQEIEVKFLQRSTFSTEKTSGFLLRKLPAVMHSVWQAPDGRKAIILINYTDKEQACSFNGVSYTVPPRTPVMEPLA